MSFIVAKKLRLLELRGWPNLYRLLSLHRVARECQYFKDLGENFLPAEDSKAIYNAERDETVIKDMHLKRLISTYQHSYCVSEGKKSMVIDPNNLDADEFLVYFNNYFAERTQAVPRPLDTSRRVFGYSRFDRYYTDRTTYDDHFSREGYDYFKKDYDRGLSRLFRKKQMAWRKQNLPPEELVPPEVTRETRDDPPETSKQPSGKVCALCCGKFGGPGPEQRNGGENPGSESSIRH